MQVKELSFAAFLYRIKKGITIKTGNFTVQLTSNNMSCCHSFYQLYAEFPVLDDNAFVDFPVSVTSPSNIRKWILPKVNFSFDGLMPFKPLPKSQSYPLFEWGMNWCIATHAHQYLIIHAATIESNNCTVIMPAPPGSGKSTLCAALVNRGWRLLSDELTLIDLQTGNVHPLCRPVNLKNDSIDIIKSFAPDSEFSQSFYDTHKGTVALMKPSRESVLQMDNDAKPTHIFFPKYQCNSAINFESITAETAFTSLIQNCFNYDVLDIKGFTALTNLINTTAHYNFTYSSLEQAIDLFYSLAHSHDNT